jgi:hypothetical protein
MPHTTAGFYWFIQRFSKEASPIYNTPDPANSTGKVLGKVLLRMAQVNAHFSHDCSQPL